MTWAVAKVTLAKIIEGTPVKIGRRFLYDGKHGASTDRSFSFEIVEETVTNVFNVMTAAKVRTAFDIVVVYKNDDKGSDVQDMMASDYARIVKRLNDSSNWQRPLSTITFMDNPLPQFRKTVEREDGRAIMRIACAMVHIDDGETLLTYNDLLIK